MSMTHRILTDRITGSADCSTDRLLASMGSPRPRMIGRIYPAAIAAANWPRPSGPIPLASTGAVANPSVAVARRPAISQLGEVTARRLVHAVCSESLELVILTEVTEVGIGLIGWKFPRAIS